MNKIGGEWIRRVENSEIDLRNKAEVVIRLNDGIKKRCWVYHEWADTNEGFKLEAFWREFG